MQNVNVVSIEEDGVFDGETTVAVTLQRDNVKIKCEGILIWEDDEDELESVFEEWLELAQDGIDGFTVL